jgi:hypothetical protein
MKKAQTWSLETIVSLSVFLVLLVGIIFVFYAQPLNQTANVAVTNDPILAQLSTAGNSPVAILEGNVVNTDKLQEISDMNYEDLKSELGLSDDFCIIFVTKNGTVIPVNGTPGVGSSQIIVGGHPCGQAIS